MTIKKNVAPIKVFVAIPNQGNVSCHVAQKLIQMVGESIVNKNFDITLKFSQVTCIDFNRNLLARQFLESDCQWLFMMDDDNPCLKNPLDLIELNKDVTVYPTLMQKTLDNGDPLVIYNIFRRVKDGCWGAITRAGGPALVEVDAGGTGCVLIKRKVIAALEAPFKSKMKRDGTRKYGQDLYFCERAKKKGFKIWTHWDYACQHFKTIDLIEVARMLLRDKYKVKPEVRELVKKI